jgi:hypothetical protein
MISNTIIPSLIFFSVVGGNDGGSAIEFDCGGELETVNHKKKKKIK